MLDPESLRGAARLARFRALEPSLIGHRDGLERLGAQRALNQLARDLDASADYCEVHRHDGNAEEM